MNSYSGNKVALIATGIGLGLVAAYKGFSYFLSRNNEEALQEPLLLCNELNEIIKYSKIRYLPVLNEISELVRKAKEELEYNEAFGIEMEEKRNSRYNNSAY